jgi:hypothetical protein
MYAPNGQKEEKGQGRGAGENPHIWMYWVWSKDVLFLVLHISK